MYITNEIIYNKLNRAIELYLNDDHPILKEKVKVITIRRYDNQKPYLIMHIKSKGFRTFCGTKYTPSEVVKSEEMTVEEFIYQTLNNYKELKDVKVLSEWRYITSDRFCVRCVKKLLIAMNVFPDINI